MGALICATLLNGNIECTALHKISGINITKCYVIYDITHTKARRIDLVTAGKTKVLCKRRD